MHHDTDQNQLNACRNAESQCDTEYVLPQALPDKTTKTQQQEDKPTLHNAHTAVKAQYCRNHSVRGCGLRRKGIYD